MRVVGKSKKFTCRSGLRKIEKGSGLYTNLQVSIPKMTHFGAFSTSFAMRSGVF